jgi:hypothetical protein
MTSTLPSAVYLERLAPLGKIHLWPIPTTAATLVLFLPTPIARFATVQDSVYLMPGFEDAVVSNLAVRCGIEFGKPADQALMAIADESRAKVDRIQAASLDVMRFDSALLGGCVAFDIYSGV